MTLQIRTGAEHAAIGAVLVVPCYNEANHIFPCLDGIERSPLPPGIAWARWVVVDDASADGTSAQVERWSQHHPDYPVQILRNPRRMGKAATLEAVRAHVDETLPGGVMVVVDADGDVATTALSRLMAPFVEDPAIAVTWGWSIPRGPRRRCLASRFQMRLGHEWALATAPDGIPAMGRLFAIRPSTLAGFRWEPGFVSDDIPLAEHVRRVGVRHRLVPTATIAVKPASTFRDFYLQTYRYYASKASAHAAHLTQNLDVPQGPQLSALASLQLIARATLHEPFGLPAYVTARLLGAALHSIHPTVFTDTWPIARSTK